MTSKQKVEDFLQFLNYKNGSIVTDNGAYSYKEMREAIINCLKQAMEDGYKQGQLDEETSTL